MNGVVDLNIVAGIPSVSNNIELIPRFQPLVCQLARLGLVRVGDQNWPTNQFQKAEARFGRDSDTIIAVTAYFQTFLHLDK